ncbi:MAG: hypothetical protein AAGC55_26460 [Myxococcota bacterium]
MNSSNRRAAAPVLAAAVALAVMGATLGCGGGSAAPPPATSAETDEKQRALAALDARQEAACEKVGVVLIDCAIADARTNMSPDELAELDLENTAPVARAKFVEECTTNAMSVRQVKVFEGCLVDTSCTTIHDCLDQAR